MQRNSTAVPTGTISVEETCVQPDPLTIRCTENPPVGVGVGDGVCVGGTGDGVGETGVGVGGTDVGAGVGGTGVGVRGTDVGAGVGTGVGGTDVGVGDGIAVVNGSVSEACSAPSVSTMACPEPSIGSASGDASIWPVATLNDGCVTRPTITMQTTSRIRMNLCCSTKESGTLQPHCCDQAVDLNVRRSVFDAYRVNPDNQLYERHLTFASVIVIIRQ